MDVEGKKLAERRRRVAVEAERGSAVVSVGHLGVRIDPHEGVSGKGQRVKRGIVVVEVNELARERRLFDLAATLDDGYTPR